MTFAITSIHSPSVFGFQSIMEFFYLLTLSSVALCSMVPPLEIDYPPDYCENIIDTETFDFIVIGSGPGGSAVSRRLAENHDWNILLLEAGDDPSDDLTIPSEVLLYSEKLRQTPSWNFTNTPSPNHCRGMNDGECNLRLAKVLGGNSNANYMIHNRGQASDYDNWASKGNPIWTADQCLPYLKKLENFLAYPLTNIQTDRTVLKQYHRRGGPMTIGLFGKDPYSDNLRFSITEAAKDLGLPETTDFYTKPLGILNTPVFADSVGYRFSSARGYLTNIPNNLKICKNAFVDKVELKGTVAKGVTFTYKNDQVMTIKANKEVIISAGSYASPGILERSGIGNSKYLRKAGVKPKHHLPGVGENLQDHFIATGNIYGVDPKAEGIPNVLTTGVLDLVAEFNSKNIQEGEPDMQMLFAAAPIIKPVIDSAVGKALNLKEELLNDILELGSPGFLLIAPAILTRDTTGGVHIVSKDSSVPPKIVFNVFNDKKERKRMARGLMLADKIANSKALRMHQPKKAIYSSCLIEAGNSTQSYRYYECLAKTISAPFYHPTGTCKMGPVTDKMAVVDQYLLVHGIDNLRVIDASIMPDVTKGNAEGPTLMIAERGADFIKQKWRPRLWNQLFRLFF